MNALIPTIEIGAREELPRVSTGIPQLDFILGRYDKKDKEFRLGMPLASLYEIYGPPYVGKSTLAMYLSARVDPEGLVAMVDLEAAVEVPYLRNILIGAGFHGLFRVLAMVDERGKIRPQEDVIQESVDMLLEAEATAGVLDSVGMFAPVAEVSSDLTDAVMGRRAKILAAAARRLMARLRGEEKAYFMVNHELDYLGHGGIYTPGGKTKTYASGVRLRLKSQQTGLPHGGVLSKVVVTKLRSGGIRKSEKEAFICIIPNFGISPELSTMFEAIDAGKATGKDMRKAVTVGGQKIARIKDLFDKAMERDTEIFKPFYEVMEWKYEPIHITIGTE